MAKIYPPSATFVIADNIRQETGGKLAVLGWFSGGSILYPENTQFPVNTPLGFAVIFREGQGDFVGGLKIFGPGDALIGNEVPLGDVKKPFTDRAIQLIMNFPIFPIVGVGSYKISVKLDDHAYEETFSVGVRRPNDTAI